MKFLIIFLSTEIFTQTLASPLSGRIYRGHEALEGFFPFHVLVYIRGTDYIEQCSGALIGKFWILTVAHCVEDFEETSINVHLGAVGFTDDETVKEVRPNNVYIHKSYNKQTLANDIALLKVDEVVYSDKIRPVDLPSTKDRFLNHSALTSGWGGKGNNKHVSDTLRYTFVRVLSQNICKEVYSGADEFRNSEVCVGTDLVGSPCVGDSGGPLLDITSKLLIGVLSSGYAEDCESGKPVIYTRIAYYMDWIRTITGI